MLPAAHRMRSSHDFTATTRHGARSTRGPVVAYVLSGAGDEPARVGLIVSKAIGNSVVRHRSARRLRAAVRPLLASLPQGSRLVLRALPGLPEEPDVVPFVEAAVTAARSREEARA